MRELKSKANFDAVTELVKAVILRLLIQIDRSEHVSINFIYLQIKQMLDLEALVSNNKLYDDITRTLESLMPSCLLGITFECLSLRWQVWW